MQSRRHLALLGRSPLLILPVDGGLIDGPTGGLADPGQLFQPPLLEVVDAVLGFAGLFQSQLCALANTVQILNLTVSTSRSTHSRKVVASSVEQALRLGVEAVAVHVNISDPAEGEMLANLSHAVESCARYQLPVAAIAYPRRSYQHREENYTSLMDRNPQRYCELICHAVRIAAELGADLIKTRYTGSTESFRQVVSSSLGVPIVAAGGGYIDESLALLNARSVIEAGGAGVAYGRQVFNAPDPVGFARRLRLTIDSAKQGLDEGHDL